MVALVLDEYAEELLLDERRERGIDKFDEVWDGVYVMSPLANDEHQGLAGAFTSILFDVVDLRELGRVRPGVNVTDRETDWKQNFRVPDVVVFLNETKAENRDSHWFGGPDLAIEIVSPNDRTLEKLDFYAKVGTRELLVVDRDPWALTLYRLEGANLAVAGRSTFADDAVLASEVVTLDLRLSLEEKRPTILVSDRESGREWTVRGDPLNA